MKWLIIFLVIVLIETVSATHINSVRYTGEYRWFTTDKWVDDVKFTYIGDNVRTEIIAKSQKERTFEECTEFNFTGKYCNKYGNITEEVCENGKCFIETYPTCIDRIVGEEEENCIKRENITYEVPDYLPVRINKQETIKVNTLKFTEIGKEPRFFYTIQQGEHFVQVGNKTTFIIQATSANLTLKNMRKHKVADLLIHQGRMDDGSA